MRAAGFGKIPSMNPHTQIGSRKILIMISKAIVLRLSIKTWMLMDEIGMTYRVMLAKIQMLDGESEQFAKQNCN